MADNSHLVPMTIVYVNGMRLNTEYEGAMTRVLVVDKMNGISSFVLEFEAYWGQLDQTVFCFNDKIRILLGYKDDLNEVFLGEVLEIRNKFREGGRQLTEINGCNMLWKMKSAIHYRHFENKSASGAIRELIEQKYNLQSEIDNFGMVYPEFYGRNQSDLELILRPCKTLRQRSLLLR